MDDTEKALKALRRLSRGKHDTVLSETTKRAYDKLDDFDRMVIDRAAKRLSKRVKKVGKGMALEILAAIGRSMEEKQ